MHRSMASMANHYAQQVDNNGEYQLPVSGRYLAYVGLNALPKDILRLFDQNKFSDYRLIIQSGQPPSLASRPKNLFLLFIQPLKNSHKKLYLVFNDGTSSNINNRGKGINIHPKKLRPILTVPISIILLMLLSIALVYWIARLLIIRVLNPLNELTKMANTLDENNPELSFELMNDKTEIGQVANTLHQTMGRIHQYHQREKEFLQNASHELRTPITVVSSALDIIHLRASKGNNNIADQHANIRRANNNMAEITQALLFLSRKTSFRTPIKKVCLKQLVELIIDEHIYLLKDKNVEIVLLFTDNTSIALFEPLCRIALSNIIRNAFEHSWTDGCVRIQLDKLSLSVSNSCSDLVDSDKESQELTKRGIFQGQGFGLGLDIVQQIADQQNWQLSLNNITNNGFEIIISFN
ncbi:sensor histidine kinase [Colwellia psychrerythraea]|uniref:histidine kinase n=1 Tax=Colwellia psychrerythraea TaxID=28229 RepID=A0A099KRL2_COLPS|nr:HAMP domain-containing sensor histidine kinase [Colwellia psychrerythraea]KGJ92865.1 histidine kinase [Colwellia psychrerythraea]